MSSSTIQRRTFLAQMRQAAAGLFGGSWLVGSARAQGSKKGAPATGPKKSAAGRTPTVFEPARNVPIVRKTDVLVCGAGPAGIAAAITAARNGAQTLLIERHPFLGGVWTAGALTIILDAYGKHGLIEEILRRLEARGHTLTWAVAPRYTVYSGEGMKYLLDDMVGAAKVQVQLYTQVVAVARSGNRISGVFTESKSGREFVEAKIIIDATGDGDVAAFAGCAYEKGRPSDGKMQPMTLMGRIGGYRGEGAVGQPLVDICRRAGWEPTLSRVVLRPQPNQPGVFMLMATHLYGDGTNTRDLTDAEVRGRWEIRKTLEALKQHGGDDWKDAFLLDTGPFVGIRETRRILGRYYLTIEDLKAGAHFDDGICDVNQLADIHFPDPQEGRGLRVVQHKRPYQIPYRCLLPKDVDNLMMAGRCISGDHIAHASYRVTGDAVPMGEAAGLAAAMALEAKVLPPSVDPRLLVKRLKSIRASTAPKT